jgi:hypothetical protein
MSDSRDVQEQHSQPRTRIRSFRPWSAIFFAMSVALCSCAGFCMLTAAFIRPKVGETSEVAAQAAAKITDWTLPQNFEGKSGLEFDSPIISLYMAKFAQKEGRGQLILGQVQNKIFVFQDQKEQLGQLIEKQAPELKTLNATERRVEKRTIRNLPAEFSIEVGYDLASTTKMMQIKGYFRGKRDESILILQCENGILSDQEIEEFLQSIK